MVETMASHANHEILEQDDGRSLASWQSALITLMLLFVVGLFIVNTIGRSPARPIYIESSNLTAIEREVLSESVRGFGEIPFFGGNLHQIHDSVMELSWVEHAVISRDWHHGIMVEVVPRKPIANFGSQELLDANGVVFRPANKNDVMNPNLITLHGSASQVDDIMRQMSYINERFFPLGLIVDDLILTPRNTWVIRFHNGLRVVVDSEHTEQKLYQLSVVLKTQFAEQINDMQSVDLRYKNGFSIAWKTGAKNNR